MISEDETAESTPRLETEPAQIALSDRDVRSKRPPVLAFFMRLESLRRLLRTCTLLALDFIGIFGAIFTALSVKAAVQDEWNFQATYEEATRLIAFAYLVTVLLFARSDLYARRFERPGLTKIVASLTATMLVAVIFAVVNGEEYSSYYIFYSSLLFAVIYVSLLRLGFEKITGLILKAAGYARRAVLVGTGAQIDAVAHAFRGAPQRPVELVGFISLTPRPENGLRSLGELEDLPAILDDQSIEEVIIADPDFPAQQAVELVDQCHRRGVTVRIAPSTMEILVHRAEFVPGQSVPLFELKPPVFEGLDYIRRCSPSRM